MNFEDIKYYKDNNTTLRILNKDTFPFIAGFLNKVFKEDSKHILSYKDITVKLTDYIYYLNQKYTDYNYPLTADNYLTQWADEGILRKYYGETGDEPLFEITPAMEKSLEWIEDLRDKEFIGTESRLLKIFDLLRELVFKSSKDPAIRIKELEEDKDRILREIEKINSGIIETLDSTQIKERYYELVETARRLISDFRQVEYNFRDLDRQVRVKLSDANTSKGAIVDSFFSIQDSIWETDQGRSFKAFWELLLSQTRLDELDTLILSLFEMNDIRDESNDRFIKRLKFSLTESGSMVNKTIFILIEQLARFLDEKNIDSNKRIIDLIKEIEAKSIKLSNKQHVFDRRFIQINEKPDIEQIMSRPFYKKPEKVIIDITNISSNSNDFDAGFLYGHIFIDRDELISKIDKLLVSREQVSLSSLISEFPIEKGLLELLEYYNIAHIREKTIIYEDQTEEFMIKNVYSLKEFIVKVPLIVYCR